MREKLMADIKEANVSCLNYQWINATFWCLFINILVFEADDDIESSEAMH